MAQLRNTEYFTFNRSQWMGKSSVTVGHNRTLTLEDGLLPTLVGRLHGHVIFRATQALSGTIMVCLDCAGWRTVTTRSAIGDFMGGMGIPGSASMAGGTFSARWLPHPYEHGVTEVYDYKEADEDERGQINFDFEPS